MLRLLSLLSTVKAASAASRLSPVSMASATSSTARRMLGSRSRGPARACSWRHRQEGGWPSGRSGPALLACRGQGAAPGPTGRWPAGPDVAAASSWSAHRYRRAPDLRAGPLPPAARLPRPVAGRRQSRTENSRSRSRRRSSSWSSLLCSATARRVSVSLLSASLRRPVRCSLSPSVAGAERAMTCSSTFAALDRLAQRALTVGDDGATFTVAGQVLGEPA